MRISRSFEEEDVSARIAEKPNARSYKATASCILGLSSLLLAVFAGFVLSPAHSGIPPKASAILRILTIPILAVLMGMLALIDICQPTKRLRGAVDAIGGICTGTVSILLIFAASQVGVVSPHMVLTNNYKQALLAIHSYHDAVGALPPAFTCDEHGRPLLSWRVAILPYLNAQDVFDQFHQDEPWDSPSNIKLLSRMPFSYRDTDTPPGGTTTHMQMFTGPKTINDRRDGRPFGLALKEIPDRTANTILIVEAKNAVPWSKPEDIEVKDNVPIPELGVRSGRFFLGFCNGLVRFVNRADLGEEKLRALIDPRDGKVVEVPE